MDTLLKAKQGTIPDGELALITVDGQVMMQFLKTSGKYTKTYVGGVIDCAGHDLQSSSSYEIADNGGTKILNCKYIHIPDPINLKYEFYNCKNIELNAYNIGNGSTLSMYDCGPIFKITSYDGTDSGSKTEYRFYSGVYDIVTDSRNHCVLYGGLYLENPSADKKYTLASGKNLVVTPTADGYYKVEVSVPASYIAQIVSSSSVTNKYTSLQKAFDEVGEGQTVSLLQNCGSNEVVNVSVGKNFIFDLAGYSITNSLGTINNNGTIWLMDSSGKTGVNKYSIVNYGVITNTYGTYSSSITLKPSSRFVVHNGHFEGDIVLDSTINDAHSVLELRGGWYSQNLENAGYLANGVVQSNKWVGVPPFAVKEECVISGTTLDKAWMVSAFSQKDKAIWDVKNSAYSAFSNFEDKDCSWNRYAELQSIFGQYQSDIIDAVICCDRYTAAKSIHLYVDADGGIRKVDSDTDANLIANEPYRVLSSKLQSFSNVSQISYLKYLNGDEDINSYIPVGIKNNTGNVGTVTTLELQLCTQGKAGAINKKLSLAVCRYMLGGKKAAIDRDENRFAYDSLTEAVSKAQNRETVLVGADTDENVTLPGAGEFTIDPYGFTFTGTVSAPAGCKIESTSTKTSAAVAQGVESAEATTYVVTSSVVAKVGETPYESLAEAVAEANGAVVTLVADSNEKITLAAGQTLKLAVADGAAFGGSVVSGDATCHVDSSVADGVTTYTLRAIVAVLPPTGEVQGAAIPGETAPTAAEVSAAVESLTGNTTISKVNSGVASVNEALTGDNQIKEVGVTPVSVTLETVDGMKVVKAATFDVTPVDMAGNAVTTLPEGKSLKFRLPVDAHARATKARVFHGEEQLDGLYAVATSGDEKYVELSAGAFSPYGYELLEITADMITVTDAIYQGGTFEPAVTVKDGDTVLEAGTDYTVSYANNNAVGTGTVTVTGAGNYAGSSATKNFAITGAGYGGEVLPAAPDMSGDVINVNAANAQYVLDGAYGDITGKTINFTENITERLDLGRCTKFAGSGTTTSGTTYTRTLSAVTFTSSPSVTIAGFTATSGHVYKNGDWDYVRDQVVTSTNDGYYRYSSISGVTFKGLTVTDDIYIIYGQSGTTCGDITFDGCTFAGTPTDAGSISFNNTGSFPYGDITIKNCVINSSKAGIYINGGSATDSAKFTIENNYVVAGNNNAIQLTTGSAGAATADIEGNFLKSEKYTVNLNGFAADNITLSGNAIVAGSRGHLGHFTGDASGNFWAAQGTMPDASGNMSTELTAPIADTGAQPGENDITSSSYCSTAVVDTSAAAWTTLSAPRSFVAQIGETKYATLADAFANAANGDTVTMLDDVTLTEPLNVTLGDKAVTLDLGGKTLAGRTNLKSGNLTIKNGTVAGGSAQALNVYGSADTAAENYSVLTIASDVNVTADVYGVCMFGETAQSNGYGAVVNIAGTVTTTGDGKDGAVFVSGNLGKNVSGDAHNVINVTGKITSATDAAIAMNGLATVNVSAGAEVTGNTAIAVKRGTLNVTGGTIRATGEKNYEAAAYANGTEMTGAAISLSDTYSQYGAMAVNVSGGTVKSDNADALFKKDGDYKADATIAVSAGSFSSAVAEEFCAANYIPGEIDPDTGLYTVVPGTYVAQIVRGGSVIKKYTTLSGAIAASEIGDTVQLLADVTENVTVNKAITIDGQEYTLTGDGNSTVLAVVGGVTVEVKNIVIDGAALFNGLDGTVKVTGYSTLALGEGVSIKNGIYCNLYLDRGSVTGSQGVTMVGGEAVVSAEGKAMYGEKDITVAVQALSSMLNGGSSLEPGTTIGLPYFDIVRQRPDGDIVNIADGEGRVKQGASLLFLANGDFSDDGQGTVTLPTRFYSYTLNIANFVGATGWTEGEWNDIIDTGCDTIDLIAGTGQGDKPMSETVDVTLKLNEDVVIPGENGFEYRNSNFTIDGNNKAISGTIVYTDNAGTMENVVMGTEEEPLVLDMTGLSAGNSINLGTGIAATNVTIKVTETQAATQGTTIVTWNAGEDGEEEAASLAAGVTVAIVDATTGEPVKDEQGEDKTASLMWDAELGIGYIGPCEARLTTVDANSETVYIYTSLAHAIELARDRGDTVTLMMDIENFTGTQDVNKSLVLDGAEHTIKADASASSTGAMFNVRGDEVVIKNMTIDGDHKYWYCVQALNGACTLQDMTILNGAQRMGDENNPQVGYGAAVHVNGADLRVSGEFNAIGGGKTAGVFPFTAILYSDGTVYFADGAEADIGEDLLLVGMGPLNIDTFMSTYDIEEKLAEMNIPGAYIPYTLALDGTNSGMGFVGASPQPWNTIIDYGKEIMEVATEIGFGGFDMEPDTTPVEVGLLTDTELPDTFNYADTNFTVNGNGNALSGTIKYTDEAGIIKNIVLGTEEKPLILDLREVTEPVEIGNLIGVTNVTVLMTAEQATLGQPVFTWNVETAGEPDNAESVKITVLESAEVPYNPEDEAVEKGLVWDDELGIAYIGPCEARLTGPEREPGYMDLTNAFNMAVGGDTVTLFWSGVTLNEEIAFPAGTLVFATNKYELALGENAAFVFTNATSVFRSEMAFSTDIIALAGDVTSGYLLRTATDGTTNVYSVVQRGEYIVTGMTEAGTDGTAVIKVSDEWIVANMGKTSIAEIKTINEIEEYLDSRDATTGMRKWENYVLKQTEKPFRVSDIAANGALSTTLSDTPEATATTGFTVQYALNEVEANGTVKTAGTKSDGHNFSVAVDSVASSALYKVRAYLTSGESTLVVDSTNTLGVLKVQPTIARSIIAVPWKSLETGGDITVAEYIRTADLSYGDKLHVYNGSSYDTWTYSDGNWSAVKTFIAGKEGTDTTVSGSAETTTLARGTGVWLERASGTAANLYLIGEYTPEPVETHITAGSTSAMSWNLVGAPSYEQIDLNTAIGTPVNETDRIVVPMPGGLQKNFTYKKGKWGYSDARTIEVNGRTRVQTFHNTNAVLPAGTGFWYLNTGDAGTIKW